MTAEEYVLTDEFKEEVFVYLDALRKSGVTNMYGARPYIMEWFEDITKKDATALLFEWMQTFTDRHPEE